MFFLYVVGCSYGARPGDASGEWGFFIMAGVLATAGRMLRDRRPRRKARRAAHKKGRAVYLPKKRVVDGGKARRQYGPPA